MDDLRALPSVDEVLRDLGDAAPPAVARWIVRRAIDAARARILAGGAAGDVRAQIDAAIAGLHTRRVRRVINATGVVLHTNLGRAPLSDDARAAVLDAMGAATIEYDLEAGERSARAPVAATLAAALCDADDALIVNNNAGALLLLLAALARGREVIVSRGELIEIGGSFRLPEVMEASGAILREVGTTNRTRAADYERALGERTGLVLAVHPSNFTIVGFTERPALTDLAAVAHAGGVPFAFDTGSGLLGPTDGPTASEPDAASALASGADLVCFSGDKLLGGPQAGVIVGSAALVERCRRHPIARAVRADKLSLAAMEATLWSHAAGEPVPVHRMISASMADVERRARALAAVLDGARVETGESVIGGGTTPGVTLPSAVLLLPCEHPTRVAAVLRRADPPIIVRIERDAVALDLRSVDPRDDDQIKLALTRAR